MADATINLPAALAANASIPVLGVTVLVDPDANVVSDPAPTAPLIEVLERTYGALGATVERNAAFGEAPYAGTITGVSYTPKANITGANTDLRTLQLMNHGLDGDGNHLVAQITFQSGVNATDYNETALTLTDTLSHREVTEGDILEFVSSHSGAGLADPGGLLQVEITRL